LTVILTLNEVKGRNPYSDGEYLAGLFMAMEKVGGFYMDPLLVLRMTT